jgi:hypothetical protein
MRLKPHEPKLSDIAEQHRGRVWTAGPNETTPSSTWLVNCVVAADSQHTADPRLTPA